MEEVCDNGFDAEILYKDLSWRKDPRAPISPLSQEAKKFAKDQKPSVKKPATSTSSQPNSVQGLVLEPDQGKIDHKKANIFGGISMAEKISFFPLLCAQNPIDSSNIP